MNMKKVTLLLLSIVVSIFLLGCSEADTILPDDDIWHNTNETEGKVTYIRAFVNSFPPNETTTTVNTSKSNPYIIITFQAQTGPDDNRVWGWQPADSTTITYNDTIIVEYTNGSPITYTTDPIQPTGDAFSVNIIRITLSPPLPTLPTTVKITLSPNIKAYCGDDVYLSSPYTFNITVAATP